MKTTLLTFTLVIILSGLFCCPARSRDTGIDAILDSAEGLFRAMKLRDYKSIWSRLTDKSRAAIVNDSYKEIAAKTGNSSEYSKEVLERDFHSGGPIAKSYWDAYLQNFDPDWLLEESRWQIGELGKDRAEIVIHYRKGEGPVILVMTRQNADWKVGLMETFRPSAR
jgi:hypothetical protein